MRIYTNVILTVIALLLGAIVAKMYFYAPNQFGPSLVLPRQGDFLALKDIPEKSDRDAALGRVARSVPVAFDRGGNVEVSGEVEVSGGRIYIDQ